MEEALSLQTGGYVNAAKGTYASSRDLLLTCPECGEPVYFKVRQIPHRTLFFSHYQEIESINRLTSCSLRGVGATPKRASQVLSSGLSQGQFVDRFQKEFCSGLNAAFGRSHFCPHAPFRNILPTRTGASHAARHAARCVKLFP